MQVRQIMVFVALVIACSALGCAVRVGSKSDTDATKTSYTNGSPNTIGLTDPDGNWTANGTGPQQFTDMNDAGLQTFRQGSTPREIFWDGSTKRLVVSSGSDIRASNIEYDPKSGKVRLGEFSTSASEPLRAGNEALDRLVAYWAARDEASKQAIIAQIEAAKDIAPDVKDLILGLFTGL